MNEQEASRLATLIAKRWPTRIQAKVEITANRKEGPEYLVRLAIPRENRVLRLAREKQLPGILDVCTALMTPDDAPLPPVQPLDDRDKKEEKDMSTEQMEQQEQESDMFTEEEAAAYLGIKPVSIRAYAANDTLSRLPDGGFLLADLRRYKDARDTRGRAPKPATLITLPSLIAEESTIAANESTAPTVGAVDSAALPVPAVSLERDISPSEEERIIQAVIAHTFASVPGIRSLGRLSEVPRSWKVDVMTERGPESYRVMRGIDGSFRQERW
jgi:hypothetical protein